MKSTTKQIVVIILATMSILLCLFKGGQSLVKEATHQNESALSGADREQVLSIAKSIYGNSIDEEKINNAIDSTSKVNYKLLAVAIILDIIIIILAARNIINNRNSIIALGITSAFLTPTILGTAMGITLLVISLIPSYDKQYQKQIAPKVEEVNTCKIVFYIILFSFVYLFFYCGIFSMMFKWLNLNDFMSNHQLLINAIMFSLMLVATFLMLRKEIIRDIKLFFKKFSTYLNIISPIFVIGMIIQLIIGVVLLLITKTSPTNQSNVNAMPLWFLIVFAILIGPAVEEFFFRGFIKKFIKNNVAFVIVSSILFSVMHVVPYAFFNPIQWIFVIQYLSIAVPMSYAYVKTNNLASAYFFHLCWNSVAILTTAIALI